MITAITQPLMALICVASLIFGRFFYSIGYCKFGPKGRLIGAIIADLGLIALLVGSIITIVTYPTDTTTILPISAKEAAILGIWTQKIYIYWTLQNKKIEI